MYTSAYIKTHSPETTVFTKPDEVFLHNCVQLEVVWQAEQDGEEEAREGEQEGGPHPPEHNKTLVIRFKTL